MFTLTTAHVIATNANSVPRRLITDHHHFHKLYRIPVVMLTTLDSIILLIFLFRSVYFRVFLSNYIIRHNVPTCRPEIAIQFISNRPLRPLGFLIFLKTVDRTPMRWGFRLLQFSSHVSSYWSSDSISVHANWLSSRGSRK